MVTLEQVKSHLRIDGYDQDTYLSTLIISAVKLTERATGRALLRTSFSISVDTFRDIELPKPPFVAISSITYLDDASQSQTLATTTYDIDDAEEPCLIVFEKDLPQLADTRLPITINYSAGYADADAIPEPIKQYVLMIVGSLYDTSRSAHSEYALHTTPTARMLIAPYMVGEI